MKRFKLPSMNKSLRPLVEMRKKNYDKHFRHNAYRTNQLEAITLIGELLGEVDNIVVEAPTGSGKSDIAMTVCEYMHKEEGWDYGMLSSQLNLMKQYLKDFPDLKELKGRKNFGCDIEPCTAAEAPCAKIKGFKCPVDKFEESKRYHTCGYFVQKRVAEEAPAYISTPWYVFLETSRLTSKFRGRDLMVLDEAHNLENILVEQLQENWSMRNHNFVFGKEKAIFPNYAEAWTEDGMGNNAWSLYFKDCKKAAKVKKQSISEWKKSKAGRKDDEYEKAVLQLGEINSKLERLNKLLEAPYSILAEVKQNKYGRVASFKPLSVRNFAPEIFQRVAKKRVFMSATIDEKLFVDSLGLDKSNTAFIEITESNFPLESREVKMSNVSKMSFSEGFRKAVPKIGEFIRDRLLDHQGENAFIYAPSYDLCNKIAEYLKPHHPKILTHNESNRNEIVKKFIEGPERGYVLISPSLSEGYDLKGDICRLLVVVKIPYPSIGDTLVRRRMLMHEREWRDKHEGSPLCPYEMPTNGVLCSNYACEKPCQAHYRAQAAFKIVQVIGRGVRSKTDFCETWIIDSGFSNFLRSSRNHMPEWFIESLRKV